jgi:hypothetical protein
VGSPGACTIGDPNCAAIGDAVAAAAPGDTINVAAGIYNESNIVIDKDLTISGAGANTTIVDAQQSGRVFYISCGTINISGLTIKNGFPGGLRLPAAGPTSKNRPTVNGVFCGAISLASDGGGIFNQATLNLTSCTVSDNATPAGAGVSPILTTSPKSSQRFAHVVKAGLATQLPGGGPGGRGGGIFNQGTLSLRDSTVSNNRTGVGGDSDTTGGNGGDGGGIFNLGTLTITNSTIANNQTGRGGNIFSIPFAAKRDAATPSLVVSGPGNGGEGGGISNGGSLDLRNSTIAGNETGPAGGFIGIMVGAAKRASGTVAPSDASAGYGGNGGGLYTGTTVVGVTVQSTIIAKNTVGAGGVGPDVFSDIAINSLGFNLIGITDGSSGFTQATDQTGTIASPLDPVLGSLLDNGGPTKTMALLANSPAIDKGMNSGCLDRAAKTTKSALACGLPFDQRGPGFPRTSDNGAIAPAAGGDNTDIGAFEAQFGGPCAPDVTPPVITCPGSLTKFTDSGQFTATVNPGAPVATDNCALQSVTGVRSDGKALSAPYPIGVTLIVWTARDASGNIASCGQSIAVMVPSGKPRNRIIP